MLERFVPWLVEIIGSMGYPGIVALMFLESSFFPFPSEVVVPPAGYLAAAGQMNLFFIIAAGIAGSILGALFNYWISLRFGRPFFQRWGKYLLVSEKTLDKAEVFFKKHGHISTFIGRLIPGVRQLISLPAGVARMRMDLFLFYTALGSGIWVTVLALVGYWVGNNQELVMDYLDRATLWMVSGCIALAVLYMIHHRRKNRGGH
ncbi:MAG: DedA family protein [Thermovirgaceae bacterium]